MRGHFRSSVSNCFDNLLCLFVGVPRGSSYIEINFLGERKARMAPHTEIELLYKAMPGSQDVQFAQDE